MATRGLRQPDDLVRTGAVGQQPRLRRRAGPGPTLIEHRDDAGWFAIDFDDTGDEVEDENGLTGSPAALLTGLRERSSIWYELELAEPQTFGWYADSRMHVLATISDRQGSTVVGCLRVEVDGTEWRGAWVSVSSCDHDVFELTNPMDRTDRTAATEQQAAHDAVAWLEAQLRRPVVRRHWHQNGELVARSWQLVDSGRTLVVSGGSEFHDDPDSADEVFAVRP